MKFRFFQFRNVVPIRDFRSDVLNFVRCRRASQRRNRGRSAAWSCGRKAPGKETRRSSSLAVAGAGIEPVTADASRRRDPVQVPNLTERPNYNWNRAKR